MVKYGLSIPPSLISTVHSYFPLQLHCSPGGFLLAALGKLCPHLGDGNTVPPRHCPWSPAGAGSHIFLWTECCNPPCICSPLLRESQSHKATATSFSVLPALSTWSIPN